MTSVVEVRTRARAMVTEPQASYRQSSPGLRRLLAGATVTSFALMLLLTFLAPLAYMASTSVKSSEQISDSAQPLLPRSPVTVEVDGRERPVLLVPVDGETREMVLVKPGRKESVFADPEDTSKTMVWQGVYRTLQPVQQLDPQFKNFATVWSELNFPLLLRNTFAIALLGMVGTVISSVLVAYGLSRFRIPFAGFIVASLVAAIILPRFLTIVPTYAIYQKLGLIGTFAPLVLPHFFANAYNVFLLRQFFLSIPKEMDEAAAIDGAGPLRTLWEVIVPQARPAILTVAILHFLFAWNDFLEPLVFLSGKDHLLPISVGLYQFLGLYSVRIGLLQAGALLGMAIPILVFVLGQRIFLRGIDLSGSSK